MPVTRGYCIQIVNNTADQAQIQALTLLYGGKWEPRLPSLLSGQGGGALGEAYGPDLVAGSFTVLLPSVIFWCSFGYNDISGAYFWYYKTGANVDNYGLQPKPVATTHGTTATVTINIVSTKKKDDEKKDDEKKDDKKKDDKKKDDKKKDDKKKQKR